jgi:hypothetical protein
MHTKGTAAFRANFDLPKTRRDAMLADHTDKDTTVSGHRGAVGVANVKRKTTQTPAAGDVTAHDMYNGCKVLSYPT